MGNLALDAVIYTVDEEEYEKLRLILMDEGFLVFRDPLDGFGHFEYGYHLVVVALEGARGMEVVKSWSEKYQNTQIIWITSDPYFAGVALERGIHDFILRPYTPERFQRSVEKAKPRCLPGRLWHFAPGKKP